MDRMQGVMLSFGVGVRCRFQSWCWLRWRNISGARGPEDKGTLTGTVKAK